MNNGSRTARRLPIGPWGICGLPVFGVDTENAVERKSWLLIRRVFGRVGAGCDARIRVRDGVSWESGVGWCAVRVDGRRWGWEMETGWMCENVTV